MFRNTASETVRSLLVYGYVLDPPTGDVEAAEEKASLHPTHRTYRAEKTYGVSAGKWYYEVEILSPGSVSLGWALTDAAPDAALGKRADPLHSSSLREICIPISLMIPFIGIFAYGFDFTEIFACAKLSGVNESPK